MIILPHSISAFKIREHGLQTRETLRIFDTRPQCDGGSGSFGSVRINECYAVLLVFLYGLIASTVVMVCELFWKYKNYVVKFD